ncbi:MAG TPA: DNA alkylation repair protein [Verrucomicrobiales bacterium]|nr:DNA alkylation repair protein [Verrucomicrobiales bacterium]
MTKAQVIALLKANTNDRGILNWNKLGAETGGLKSFGIGLTQLRKLAKQVGRDHELALQLWKTDNHDAKIVGLLIDERKKITRKQAEEQVEEVDPGSLSHVFSSCDATLPKAPFAFYLAKEWIKSKHDLRRRCGYGLIYELAKNTRNKEFTDEFFLDCIKRIRDGIQTEENWVRLSMGGALIGIGKRNKRLNQAAIKLAKAIGPVDYDSCNTGCEPLNILKHLTSGYLKKKLGT